MFRAFGPVPQWRFDHHHSPPHTQERSILYAALDRLTCFAEVFQEERRIHRRRNEPWLAALAIERDLHLLNLAGTWPTLAGASMVIN